MAKLVENDDIYHYLDIDPAIDDPNGVVPGIRDAAEDMLENETNRHYGLGETLTQDPYDGPGGHLIFTRRPISVLTKVEFRYLPEIVQELYYTLDLLQYVTWTPGKRRIHSRIYPFPYGYDNILITYDTTTDQPPLAQAAIRDVVAAIWRSKGSEDARSEQKGTFQHTMIRSLDDSKVWKKAIENLSIPALG